MTAGGASTAEAKPAEAKPVGPPKRRMRNYLLHAGFQLKYTIVIVVVALIIAVGMGAWLLSAFDTTLRGAEQMGQLSSRMLDLSKENARLLLADALVEVPPELVTSLEETAARAEAEADGIASAHAEQLDMVRDNTSRVRYLLIAMLVGLVLFLTAFGIVITHRVAGPIFVMTRLFRKVTAGDYSQSARGLRDRDELKEFFAAYKDMISALRQALRDDLYALDLSLGEVHSNDGLATEQAMDALRKMKAEKEAALGEDRTPSLTNIQIPPP